MYPYAFYKKNCKYYKCKCIQSLKYMAHLQGHVPRDVMFYKYNSKIILILGKFLFLFCQYKATSNTNKI